MGLPRRPAIVFGALHLVSAALVGTGVFAGLPDRYGPVDAGAAVLIALLVGSGVGLLGGTRWSFRVAVAASSVTLAMGLLLVGALALSASYLAGIYGPVGRGGAVLFVLVAALVLPYLVALPAAELVWLRRSKPLPDEEASR